MILLNSKLHSININILSNSGVVRSSLLIGCVTILIKIAGYLEKILLAQNFGTSYKVDAYTTVFTIVTSVSIFIRELIEPGFVVVFINAFKNKNSRIAWAIFNKILRYILLVTIILSLLVFLFPDVLILLFAPGFEGEKYKISVQLVQLGFPATIFLSLATHTNAALNSQKKFATAIFGDLFSRISFVAIFYFVCPKLGIFSVVSALLVSALIKVFVHSIELYRTYTISKLFIEKEYLKDMWRLTLPLLLGMIFSQASSLMDNVFASFLQSGALSALSYSRKLIELPVLVFPYIISIVIFPYLSEFALTKKVVEAKTLLSNCVLLIIAVFIPLSLFVHNYAFELTSLVFKRGAFNDHSVILTASPLAVYSYGLVFFALETVIVIFYFSISDTKTPVAIGVLCVLENIIITYFLVKTIGHAGIAMGLVVSKGTKVLVLLYILFKRRLLEFKHVLHGIFKVMIASFILFLIFRVPGLEILMSISPNTRLLFVVASGVPVYFLLLFIVQKVSSKIPGIW